MTQEVTIRESTALSVHDLQGRHDRIQQVLKGIMKRGVDYGNIPGCGDKKALLKPGAEKILSTFELAVRIEAEHITDLSDSTKVRYRIISPIVHIHTGLVVGHGVGECSSEEEKYAWKAAVCKEEWDETDPADRRTKWKKGKPNYQVKQIRTNPADVANTVLKMGKKRSVVDGTLTATGASDMFEQGEDVTGDEDEGFNREGMAQQKEPPKEQPKKLPPGQCMPGYANKYAHQPIAEMTLETIKEFYPGILKLIENPKQDQWKAVNKERAKAMEDRIADLEGGSNTLPATDLCQMLQDTKANVDLDDLMNTARANKDSYSQPDWETIQNVYDHKKTAFTKQK